ncbi:hypothetical protein PQ465_08750 [Sphingobacterium oryzagri]|uniref:Uncharacterized protein n=1 Tax=Sphingobacterium oryzagri TaxID=3025669 RepID=A0ABY7WQ48_9SPHI|nr:hypothetical protein [Sphingobacterium sp. KACC 22765]WDF70450.1 hypothetical protein PQ465_08750 [Sphingobacterium sp. KACC 22765]
MLKGTYHPGVLSSLYGFGTTDMENGRSSFVRYYNLEDKKRYDEIISQQLGPNFNFLNEDD